MTSNSLHSCLIPISNHNYIRTLSRNVLDKLFTYSFDSIHALTVATEQPMNNASQLSCYRAAVYRQWYGMNLWYISHDRILRITYGYKSCVGTDPEKYITKPFDTDMQIMSEYILNILRTLYSHVSTDILDLRDDFNSCTILSYFGDRNAKQHSNMTFHCDTKYTKKGIYHNDG